VPEESAWGFSGWLQTKTKLSHSYPTLKYLELDSLSGLQNDQKILKNYTWAILWVLSCLVIWWCFGKWYHCKFVAYINYFLNFRSYDLPSNLLFWRYIIEYRKWIFEFWEVFRCILGVFDNALYQSISIILTNKLERVIYI